MATATLTHDKLSELLGEEAEHLLSYTSKTVSKDQLHLPGPDFVDRIFMQSDRNAQVLRNLQTLYSNGRLGGTGYLSILPVDQGIEHSAGASFAPNPLYFDPENIIRLAMEAGCNAVATTFGGLAMLSRKYAHKIPFVVKINHNQMLSYPNDYRQTMYGSVERAWDLGATAVGATIYFGHEETDDMLVEVADAFERAHELGLPTILWCYTRNNAFKHNGTDYHTATDLTGQAVHIGTTIKADIIKQKLPETNKPGFKDIGFGKTHDKVYTELSNDNPIDMCRYQVLNCYMGRAGLINSGGGSKGKSDRAEALRTAIINKRAGGSGLIMGRKAFQRPMDEGVDMINMVQDVYLDEKITIA